MHGVRLTAAHLFSHLFSLARNTASDFPVTFSLYSALSPTVFSSLAIITLPRKSDMWFSSCLRNHFVFPSLHCTVHPFTCFHTFIFSFSVLSWVNSHIHKKELWKMRDDNCESATDLRNETFPPRTPPAVWRCSISASCCVKYPKVDFCLVWSHLIRNSK